MNKTPIKMLSIDDRMLTTDLDRAGYRNMGIAVRQVTSFQNALEAVQNGGVDIIVINSDYEKVDAYAIARHFKNDPEMKQIPVVITSVQSSAATKNKALSSGADLFVEQPVPRQYFVEKLKKLLEQQTRGDDRIDLQETVAIEFSGTSCVIPISDLSISGMLVASDFGANSGDQVELTFTIPGSKKPVKASGVVVRKIAVGHGNAAEENNGVGIRFERFEGDSEKRLEKYVAKTADKEGKMIYYL